MLIAYVDRVGSTALRAEFIIQANLSRSFTFPGYNVRSPNYPSIDTSTLSPNALKLFELKNDILQEWSDRLRQMVTQARKLPHPILIDTIPALFDNLVLALALGYPRLTATEGTTIAAEHGNERARLTDYDVSALIYEYQLLRSTIYDVLRRNGVHFNDDELLIVNASFDELIRDAVSAFALTVSRLREQFVAALTHDLRNPLSTAHISAVLIKRSTDLPKIGELADRIVNNLRRVDGMIQDLLDAIIFQSGERPHLHIAEVDIMDIAREVCDQFAVEHGPRFRITGNSVTGWWDGNALKRALENLVSNGLKYGAADTPINIAISSEHGRLLLTVHDEGDPIPPEQIEGVFQIFQRAAVAKESGKQGWGLGLPYVRSVAESHGGSINVDSSEARGTTFMIDIPLDARPFQDAPEPGKDGS